MERQPGELCKLCSGNIFWSLLAPQQILIKHFYILYSKDRILQFCISFIFKRKTSSVNPGPNAVLLNLCLTTSVGISNVQDSVLHELHCCSGLKPPCFREWDSSAPTRAGKIPGQPLQPLAKALDLHTDPVSCDSSPVCSSSALSLFHYQNNIFGEVQVFDGSCGGTLGMAEHHCLTGNWDGEKEHLVSVANWTKEDGILGHRKGWAEGRVSGYHYLQQQRVPQPLMAQGLFVLVVRISIEMLCW